MPRGLDPPPVETEKKSGKLVAHEIFRNTPDDVPRKRGSSPEGRVSFPEYEELLSDRPEKFSQEEVNYREAEGEEKCKLCFHFFTQGGGDRRTVCEIFRPSGEDESVNPGYVCDFFTKDSKEYPLLEEEDK